MVDGSNILAGANINIYLNNVNINTFAGPALQIRGNVEAAVTIHLTGTNNLITKYTYSAGLQKDNEAPLIIKTNDSDTTAGILNARSDRWGMALELVAAITAPALAVILLLIVVL